MVMMTHTKLHFNRLMLTLIFGIRDSKPPPSSRALRTTEKAGPDRVKATKNTNFLLSNMKELLETN